MLPRNTVVCVAKNHGRDRFPNANSFEVGCEATSESVPALPFYPHLLERLFHLATIQGIKIKRFPDTVCKDRPRCWEYRVLDVKGPSAALKLVKSGEK